MHRLEFVFAPRRCWRTFVYSAARELIHDPAALSRCVYVNNYFTVSYTCDCLFALIDVFLFYSTGALSLFFNDAIALDEDLVS